MRVAAIFLHVRTTRCSPRNSQEGYLQREVARAATEENLHLRPEYSYTQRSDQGNMKDIAKQVAEAQLNFRSTEVGRGVRTGRLEMPKVQVSEIARKKLPGLELTPAIEH